VLAVAGPGFAPPQQREAPERASQAHQPHFRFNVGARDERGSQVLWGFNKVRTEAGEGHGL